MPLFDLPETRGSKSKDSELLKKIADKKPSPITIKGGSLLEKITSINALVQSKLGKYADQYEYYMAEDEEKFKEYIYNLSYLGSGAVDTETTGLDPISDKIVGFSVYGKGLKGLYVPINHKSYVTGMPVEGQLDPKLIKEQLLRIANIDWRMYNGKFDTRVIRNQLGVDMRCWYDAHLAAMCLNENEPHGLKTLHSKYVLDGKEDEFSFGNLFEGITFDLVPIKTGYIYAARDAVDTDELADWQLPYLTEGTKENIEYGLEGAAKVFWNIEMPCLPVLSSMEDNGIALDLDYADELSKKYHEELDKNLEDANRAINMYSDKINAYRIKNPNNKLSDPINISSPVQLAILLYDILNVGIIDEKSPRGTGVEILEKIDNPICEAILKYRTTAKLLSTYIDKLPECVNNKDGRVHCNFNQYGAKTGRMSSDDPNLQNIPSHNKDIRKMFIAEPGNVLLSSDYSQQEPKVMTVMCGDPTMIDAYKHGKDLYASLASIAFNKSYEDCLEFRQDGTTNKEGKERRSSAKSIFLGILYGRGINSIAEQLHTTKQKAQQIQDKIFKEFPAIKQFEDDSIYMAKEYGFVTTFWGRKRRLPDMQLNEFEFYWKPGYGDMDPLSFDSEVTETAVPEALKQKYLAKLRKTWGKGKKAIYEEASSNGITIVDNGGKIADATRQVVNSRIQGSAADLTKLAAIEIFNNERLRELGFKLLVPVHDEFIAECPRENAKECAELFSKCMSDAARDMEIPISTDVSITERWYGEEIRLEDL